MKNRVTTMLAALAAVFAWSSSAHAGCNNAEVVGTWDVTFSDGNSCSLRLNLDGNVIADESVCYDPFRGSTTPDSGTFDVASDCSVSIDIVVEGLPVDLDGRIARGRASGAGRYVVSYFGVKGLFTMVRMP
jgi:hypothetical protein